MIRDDTIFEMIWDLFPNFRFSQNLNFVMQHLTKKKEDSLNREDFYSFICPFTEEYFSWERDWCLRKLYMNVTLLSYPSLRYIQTTSNWYFIHVTIGKFLHARRKSSTGYFNFND